MYSEIIWERNDCMVGIRNNSLLNAILLKVIIFLNELNTKNYNILIILTNNVD